MVPYLSHLEEDLENRIKALKKVNLDQTFSTAFQSANQQKSQFVPKEEAGKQIMHRFRAALRKKVRATVEN